MRIGAKIELGYDDDFFVGFEIESELFAVIVWGLGHDDKDVAFRIGLLGRGKRERPRPRRFAYVYTPPWGGG